MQAYWNQAFMKYKISIPLFFLLLLASLAVSQTTRPSIESYPFLSNDQKSLMLPYLLPLDHPAKPILDEIFSKKRVTENRQSLVEAGFELIAPSTGSFVIVARHPSLPGYVLKIYLDSETRFKENRRIKPYWELLTNRCIGAEKLKKVIEKNNITHFVVPDKWLYILPISPKSSEKNPQPAVLLETDMQIESDNITALAWKTHATAKHLDELYTIVKQGLGSTSLIINVPYTKTGKFAFIDTEYPKESRNIKNPKKYLSKEMQAYWDKRIKKKD
jgi:hypothetical protein